MSTRRSARWPLLRAAGVLGIALLTACSGVEGTPQAVSGSSDGAPASTSTAPGTASGTTSPPAEQRPEPLACEHTGGGTDYRVGPDQEYTSIGDVPWAGLQPGDTVRIFWRNEAYHEKFLIQGQGTEDSPIVVCGVAGPGGQLPVIDGENATTASNMGYVTDEGQGRGLIHISLGEDDEWGVKPSDITIAGLHLRGAFYQNEYTRSDGTTSSYTENAACIFVERGDRITVRGVELEGCGNGLFVASGDSEEVRSTEILLERSYVHGNGTPETGPDQRHNIYTEADGIVFQFNEIGPLADGAMGAALKDRSTGTVIRYNRITGGSRSLDLVDAEDSSPLAREDPDYRTTLVYGNVIVNDAAVHGPILSNMVHYGGDSGIEDNYRGGTLFFLHNTVIIRTDQADRWTTSLFDLDTPAETAVVDGNVFYVRSVTPGADPTETAWGRFSGDLQLGTNWASPAMIPWRSPDEGIGTIEGLDNVLTNSENDPGFVDEAAGDFAPAAGSPLIDAATTSVDTLGILGITLDTEFDAGLAGRLRTADGPTDLGAFESTGAAAVAPGGSGETTPTGTEEQPPATTGGGSTAPGSALPDDAPAYAGKGPDGADNGETHPCGAGVLCVGGSGEYSSINAAIAAAKAGDVIQVAAGTYDENVALGSFTGLDPRNLVLLGGFTADFGSRDAAANRTVIDGGGRDPAVQLHVQSTGTTVFDGFAVTGGLGLGTGWEDGDGTGGGIHTQQQGSGTMVISHNEIYGNRTRDLGDDDRGGGIHANAADWDGSAPTVRIEHNNVHDNEAGRGAGIEVRGHAAVIDGNLIDRNLAHSDHGGGLYLSALENTVTNNIVRGNEIGVTAGYGWGGGIMVAGVPATMSGNVVTANFAPSMGSGVFWDEGAVGTMTDDLIVANRCPTDGRSGAAIYVDGGDPGPSTVTAENLTVTGHACSELPDGGAVLLEGGSTIDFTRSILWANGTDVVAVEGEKFTFTDSTTSGDADPLFTDPAAGDYSLQPGSPAAGRGAFR